MERVNLAAVRFAFVLFLFFPFPPSIGKAARSVDRYRSASPSGDVGYGVILCADVTWREPLAAGASTAARERLRSPSTTKFGPMGGLADETGPQG